MKRNTVTQPLTRLPRHIAIIMDGNGRWAKKRLLPRTAGHKVGCEKIFTAADSALAYGIPFLSIFAFSTENWNRPKDEINFLFGYLESEFSKRLPELNEKGIKVRVSGKISDLPVSTQEVVHNVCASTAQNSKLVLNVCLNYGGRYDIVQAAARLVALAEEGKLAASDVTPEAFASHLLTDGLPDVDLLIRTSGEMRISNFLLYQAAYAEFIFTPVLWPDFGKKNFQQALEEYARRDRRYGGIK